MLPTQLAVSSLQLPRLHCNSGVSSDVDTTKVSLWLEPGSSPAPMKRMLMIVGERPLISINLQPRSLPRLVLNRQLPLVV